MGATVEFGDDTLGTPQAIDLDPGVLDLKPGIGFGKRNIPLAQEGTEVGLELALGHVKPQSSVRDDRAQPGRPPAPPITVEQGGQANPVGEFTRNRSLHGLLEAFVGLDRGQIEECPRDGRHRNAVLERALISTDIALVESDPASGGPAPRNRHLDRPVPPGQSPEHCG